jgi:hypothetical protein
MTPRHNIGLDKRQEFGLKDTLGIFMYFKEDTFPILLHTRDNTGTTQKTVNIIHGPGEIRINDPSLQME